MSPIAHVCSVFVLFSSLSIVAPVYFLFCFFFVFSFVFVTWVLMLLPCSGLSRPLACGTCGYLWARRYVCLQACLHTQHTYTYTSLFLSLSVSLSLSLSLLHTHAHTHTHTH